MSLPKDTPDIVILVTEPIPVLIAIEAKLYDRPSRPALLKQLQRQRAQLEIVCSNLATAMSVSDVTLEHWVLLPAQLADSVGDLGTPCGDVAETAGFLCRCRSGLLPCCIGDGA